MLALVASLQAPAVAQGSGSYPDVPSDAYYAVPVARLAEQGVFEGTLCSDGFCPDGEMDRKTMAVWVVRVLDGADPSPISRSRFDDVDADSLHAPFIERMAKLGITEGCGDGSGFCPDRSVTRAQMAVFLSRAYKLPAAPARSFVDVASDAWYAGHVARLAASGITEGCGDGSGFCPDSNTTRGQMATFLHRGLWHVQGTNENELSRWVKSAIVDSYGAEAPWLREVWAYTDRPGFSYNPGRHPTSNALASMVWNIRSGGGSVFPQIESYGLYADREVINNPFHNSSLIHELAHVYTIDGYNAARNPEALAAGWLYFDSIAGSHCDPLELYAETAEALEPFGMRNLKQVSWWDCPNLPAVPTDEAVEVVSQAFSGRLPDWFYDRFRQQDGTWAYEEIWREVKYSSPDVRRIVVPMLRRSFGGYCSEEAVRQTLFATERRPHLIQPWRDGGCEELSTSTNLEFLTEENELSLWVKSAVIDKYGDKWPWLKEAWDYTNRPDFKYLSAGESGGWEYPYQYIWAWRQPEETGDVFGLLASDGMSVAKNTIKNNYLHEPTYELARMYIHNYDLAKSPEAVVAGWLYFIQVAGYDCNPAALYIDTAISLEPDFIDKEYWWEWEWAICNHLPQQPKAEALEVARQVYSGQVPDWFYENYQEENGQWDYQEIWTAVINTTTSRTHILPMLRHSFGGYCSEQAVADASYLMSNSTSSLTLKRMAQPWHDGGCGQTLESADIDMSEPPARTEYATEENEFSRWVKNDVVDKYGSNSPWLREVWDYTNRREFQYVVARPIENSPIGRIFQIGSSRHSVFTIGENTLPHVMTKKIYVSENVLNRPAGLFYPIAELAYVYIIDGARIAMNPEAVAAGWLYFDSLRRSESAANCNPHSLYADTATFIEPFQRSLESRGWQLCPHLPSHPTAEAKQVVSQAFSGQMPDWFYDNFRRQNGQWDYQEIWTAIKNSPIGVRIAVVQMLRSSFGGYCSEEAVRNALFVANPQPLPQPWRDGGC